VFTTHIRRGEDLLIAYNIHIFMHGQHIKLVLSEGRPTTILSNKIKYCLLPNWQSYPSPSRHET
jgi:hypothetical protein